LARSCVETVTTTVAIITSDELGGCSRILRIESQLKVPMLTMIITDTSAAAIGMFHPRPDEGRRALLGQIGHGLCHAPQFERLQRCHAARPRRRPGTS
jgi:hypothetical protein